MPPLSGPPARASAAASAAASLTDLTRPAPARTTDRTAAQGDRFADLVERELRGAAPDQRAPAQPSTASTPRTDTRPPAAPVAHGAARRPGAHRPSGAGHRRADQGTEADPSPTVGSSTDATTATATPVTVTATPAMISLAADASPGPGAGPGRVVSTPGATGAGRTAHGAAAATIAAVAIPPQAGSADATGTRRTRGTGRPLATEPTPHAGAVGGTLPSMAAITPATTGTGVTTGPDPTSDPASTTAVAPSASASGATGGAPATPADPGVTTSGAGTADVAGVLATAVPTSGPAAAGRAAAPVAPRSRHDAGDDPVGEAHASTPAPAVPVPEPAPTAGPVQPGGPVTTPVTTAGVSSAPGAAAGVGPAAHAVATQVFPETARLVGSGDGVHRIVLQLNPRALGEVRVVLTVRAGDVQVRFAAGDEARVALLQSSSDLHRLLEQAGAQTARVEVRDPSGAARGSSTSTPSTSSWAGPHGTAADTAGGSAQGQARTQDHHHPGTGSGHIATDGANPTTRRADRPGAGHPFDRALSSGVDLTM